MNNFIDPIGICFHTFLPELEDLYQLQVTRFNQDNKKSDLTKDYEFLDGKNPKSMLLFQQDQQDHMLKAVFGQRKPKSPVVEKTLSKEHKKRIDDFRVNNFEN